MQFIVYEIGFTEPKFNCPRIELKYQSCLREISGKYSINNFHRVKICKKNEYVTKVKK